MADTDHDSVLFAGSTNTIINKKQKDYFNSANMSDTLKSYHMVDRYKDDTNWYNKFSRFGTPLDAHNAMVPTREYLFFTRPDLYLTNTGSSSSRTIASWISKSSSYSYLTDAISRYPFVAQSLQQSNTRSGPGIGNYPFMPILSNALSHESTLELPDLSIETIETASNTYGTTMFYPGSSLSSDENFDFTLEFIDSKYLDIYTLFKIYDEYERCKKLGDIDTSGTDGAHWQKYTENRILHDAFSIYKFVVGDDGMSLIYWARITGVIPTSIPRSAMSDMNNNSDGQKISVSFKGHFVRDMDPRILYDFNCLNNNWATNRASNHNKEIPLLHQTESGDNITRQIGMVNGEWALRAQILKEDTTATGVYAPKRKYYLAWYM